MQKKVCHKINYVRSEYFKKNFVWLFLCLLVPFGHCFNMIFLLKLAHADKLEGVSKRLLFLYIYE